MMAIPVLAALAAAPAREPIKVNAYPQLVATRFAAGASGLPAGAVAGIRVLNDGRVVALAGGGSAVTFAPDGQKWAAGGDAAVFSPAQVTGKGLPAGAKVTSSARTRSGEVWMMTTEGAFRDVNGVISPFGLPKTYKALQQVPSRDANYRFVMADATGNVWLATDMGVFSTDGKDWWRVLNRFDGMPVEDILCVRIAPNGDVWGGTSQGAWRLRAAQWRYFHGKRWMPGARVNDIAFDKSGAAWLATDGGISRIEERSIKLSEKAAHYETITAARHSRGGFVTSCGVTVPGEPEKGILPEASDNDGLWTAIYVGGECYRYAVTRDPQARELAKKSMEAMFDLVRYTGVPGFPARALIRKGEKVSGYNADETVRLPGEKEKIWFVSPKDPNVFCKGDTSSDELDGHYFAWYLYYDLVATDAEKAPLREIVRAVTDNMLSHNMTLFGHTGRRTLWGCFGPQDLNDDPWWQYERGLNSTSALCYLKIAEHICGDARFTQAYEDLINKHHYLINGLEYRRGAPWWDTNHSDDELAYLVYYPLLMLEKRPERRALLVETIASTWRVVKDEQQPFFNFIYGACTGAPCNVEDAVETLQDWPWELIDWSVRNSHRGDLTLRTTNGPHKVESDRVLPASERGLMRWAGNPYECDGGADGSSEEDGGAWLVSYWMGRYHGFITE